MTKLKFPTSYLLLVAFLLAVLITTALRRRLKIATWRNNQETPCDVSRSLPINLTNPDHLSTLPAVLQTYAASHARQRACLSGGHCTEADTSGNEARALVWKCQTDLCGGLGDRVRGMRLILLLAIALDCAFFLEWPVNSRVDDSFPLTSVLSPTAIDWRIPLQLLNRSEEWKNERVRSIIFKQPSRNVLYHPFHTIPMQKRAGVKSVDEEHFPLNSTDFRSVFNPYDVVFISNRIQRSAVASLLKNPNLPVMVQLSNELEVMRKQSGTLPKIERLLTHYLFTPTAIVEEAISKRVFADEFVAVHARTGLDMGERTSIRLRRVQSKGDAFLANKMMACVTNLSTSDNAVKNLFIASDSQDFKRALSSSARKLGWATHYHHDAVFHIDLTDERSRSERCAAFVNVFADMFSLARARALVHLHSGFATTAQDFGEVGRAVELPIDEEFNYSGVCIP